MTLTVALLSIVLLITAIAVVASRSPIVSALALVGNLITVAAFYAALNAHFLAAVQILVYAGAIVVLVMFVLMLLNVKGEEKKKGDTFIRLTAAVAASLFIVLIIPLFINGVLVDGGVVGSGGDIVEGTVLAIGRKVYTEYVYCFEVASILILIAVVGAVTLGKRSRPVGVVER
jgi:NADH-quinone oxidoreductase subunit J